MNKKFLTLSTTALAAAIALAGCSTGTGSGSTGTSMPGMHHSSSAPSSAPSSSAPAAAVDHNAADTMFARMMIPHHAQAVEMSDVMLAKQGIPAPVIALATKIKADQGPEIERMTGWLASWNEPTTMPSGHSMDGMMGEADMKQFDAVQGAEAAKLFLTQMIAHHEGAVSMAETESTEGKNPDAVQLSKDIVISQQAEMQEMRDLLAAL